MLHCHWQPHQSPDNSLGHFHTNSVYSDRPFSKQKFLADARLWSSQLIQIESCQQNCSLSFEHCPCHASSPMVKRPCISPSTQWQLESIPRPICSNDASRVRNKKQKLPIHLQTVTPSTNATPRRVLLPYHQTKICPLVRLY